MVALHLPSSSFSLLLGRRTLTLESDLLRTIA
jgi:hypothetical protein